MSPRARPARPVVLAVVPAYNEEATIAGTVKALQQIDAVDEVVVVADGSTDRTAEEALAAGARVLAARRRVSKGRAVEEAVSRRPPADVYLLVDGDVGETAAQTELLLEPVLEGVLDAAIARFPLLPGGGFGLVKALSGRLIRNLSGFEADEPLSGQRALTRQALEACRPLAAGFGLETAMTIDLVRLGFRVGEVPVKMTHRLTGRDLPGFVHRGRQGLDILRAALPRALKLR